MAEPRIQYAKTSDGVSIAYYTLGDGPVIVTMPMLPWSHVEKERQVPSQRQLLDATATTRTVVRYDNRGSGLSTRNVDDYSSDAHVRDVEAVVDELGLDSFALCGRQHSVPPAIAYSARYPDRVSHLVVWSGYANAADFTAVPAVEATEAMLGQRQTWDLYIETTARLWVAYEKEELSREIAAFFRKCVTWEGAVAANRAIRQFDVSELLAQVQVPTLVIHAREFGDLGLDLSRGLASGIPGAGLVVADFSGIPSAIDEFLGEGEEPARPSIELPSGTAVILFADIVESTALTERLGDAAFRDKARELDGALRSAIRECGGTPVEGKLLGDGVLAVFTSARQAIDCALRCNAAGGSVGLPLHLGIHAGDVIREGNNVYGGAVNIAARIAGASAPGEVLVSDTVRGLARTSAGVRFEDRGEHELKGVADPQRLYVVRGGD